MLLLGYLGPLGIACASDLKAERSRPVLLVDKALEGHAQSDRRREQRELPRSRILRQARIFIPRLTLICAR